MVLRSVETKDLNKVMLIDKEVDIVQYNDKYYLLFPSEELSLEIDNPFDERGMLTNEYEYKKNEAWFKVKSYDAVYTIEVEMKW